LVAVSRGPRAFLRDRLAVEKFRCFGRPEATALAPKRTPHREIGASGYVSTARVDQRIPCEHVRCAMSMVLRRFLSICLSAIFLVGATVQVLPSGMAMADMSAQADMGGGCDQPKPPCPDRGPNCIDHFGCLSVSALPISPTALPVPFQWTAVAYELGTAPLLGLSVKPELFPPIRAA
jgi:hypothetical protein